MSLINKMLQDLDARGGAAQAGGGTPVGDAAVRAVGAPDRSRGVALAAGAGLAAVVLAGAGYFAWQHFRQPALGSTAPSAANAARAAGSASPASGATSASRASATSPATAVSGRIGVTPEPRGAAAAAAPAAAEATGAGVPTAHAPAEVSAPKAAVTSKRRAAIVSGDAKPETEKRRANGDKPAAARVATAGQAPRAATKENAPRATPEEENGLSAQQRAENEYRRALQALQDARVSDALAMLEQAVYVYPRHEAARQTLIGLLVERKQYPEAIRHLQFAVGFDPRQSNMVMLLARLQSEQGGPAIDTLQRGLQHATGNAAYRALLAGMLQRAQRHKEAIDHYAAAVQMQPGQGVWWMGLGISLQAEQRNTEAKAAYVRARDSGTLSPELQTFVERKLQQSSAN